MTGIWQFAVIVLLGSTSFAWDSDEFFIRNRNTKNCIDVSGAPGTNDGAKIQSWDCEFNLGNTDQIWKFDGVHRLVSVVSGKCLDVTGGRATNNGAKLMLWTCETQNHSTSDHEWEFVYHDAQYFQIRNRDTGKCVDVAGWSDTGNGVQIQQWDCEPFSQANSDQWWEIVRTDDDC